MSYFLSVIQWIILILQFNAIKFAIGSKQGNKDGPWTIKLTQQITKTPDKYVCTELLDICINKPCLHFIHQTNKVPLQRLFEEYKPKNKQNLVIPIDNWKHGDDILICVDDNYFMVATPMTGIILGSNTLDIVEIIPSISGDGTTWTVNKLSDPSHTNERPCKWLKHVISPDQLQKMGHQQDFPWLMVESDEAESYNHLSECDDKGHFNDNGVTFQCHKIVCTPTGKERTNPPEKQAILECFGINFLLKIFYHSATHRWCISKYDKNSGGDIKSKTLSMVLIEQGSDTEEAAMIIKKYYDGLVSNIEFWGDCVDKINSVPQRKEFEERGLLNFDTNPVPFNDLQGALKDVFAAIRRCSFIDGDEKKNCKNKKVIPWDIYQIMIDRGYLGRGKETKKTKKNSSSQKVNKTLVEEEAVMEKKSVKKKDKNIIETIKKGIGMESASTTNISTIVIIFWSFSIVIFSFYIYVR